MIDLTMGFILFCLKMVFETVTAVMLSVGTVILAYCVFVLLSADVPEGLWKKEKHGEKEEKSSKTA